MLNLYPEPAFDAQRLSAVAAWMPHPTVTPLKVNSEKNINIDNSRYLQMYIFRYFLSLVKICKKKNCGLIY